MKSKRMISFLSAVFMIVLGLLLFIILSEGFTKIAIYMTILVGLFLIFGIITFVQNRNNLVDKDEMSEKFLHAAAARSFVISFYPWIVLMIFSRLFEDSITQISVGLGAMGFIFLINYLIVRLKGVE